MWINKLTKQKKANSNAYFFFNLNRLVKEHVVCQTHSFYPQKKPYNSQQFRNFFKSRY